MIVLDASAAVELVLRTPAGARVAARLKGGKAARESVHAPHLLDLEVASVLRRLEGARAISEGDALQALADFGALAIVRSEHELLRPRVWQLRKNLTAYDAAYVALAEALDAPLLTCDARLRSSTGHRARMEAP